MIKTSNIDEIDELLELLQAQEADIQYFKMKTVFPDTGPYRRELYKAHIRFITASATHSQLAFIAANRPLADDTLVCMADGTKKLLKDIVIGDYVLAMDAETLIASPSKVIDIPFIGNEEVFEIDCTRAKKVCATADHEFPISYRSGTRRHKQLAIKHIDLTRASSMRHGLVTPVEIDYKLTPDLTVHPYVLGCLLGDGCIKFNTISFTNIDSEVLNKFKDKSGFKLEATGSITYRIVQDSIREATTGRYVKGFLRKLLNELGLKDKTHIPLQYITASKEDRLELLAGLIDTDGTCNEFVQKNEQLVKDFCQLVMSLGGYAQYSEVKKRCTNTDKWGVYYRAYYRMPYRLPLALEYKQPKITKRICDYTRNPIKAINSVGLKDVRCITIEHKDHLFLVNDFIATSNSGKTFTGAYIMTCHLTGLYPEWWEGKRFLNPISAWAAGKTNQKTKEILQKELLGPNNDIGSGMIPKHLIVGNPVKKAGLPDAVESVKIQHVSGGISILVFKSYEQGRDGFEGTKQQVVWLDEEPSDESIYPECLMRLTDEHNPGIIYCTFTPLYGLQGVALKFLPNIYATHNGTVPGNDDMFAVQTTWDDVPHISESDKKRMLAGCSAYDRDARSKGIPSLGSGAIYPYMEDRIVVEPFLIPPYWPKAYGFDTGWSRTAAVWGALDPDSGTIYIYSEYYVSESHPAIHAHAVKQRGDWIVGAADAFAINQNDGKKLLDVYTDEGLNLVKADKRDTDSGILRVGQMFEAERLKIFSTCTHTLDERRRYYRDEKGKIVKKNDHLMDALRYLIVTGVEYMELPPNGRDSQEYDSFGNRDKYTGY